MRDGRVDGWTDEKNFFEEEVAVVTVSSPFLSLTATTKEEAN